MVDNPPGWTAEFASRQILWQYYGLALPMTADDALYALRWHTAITRHAQAMKQKHGPPTE